MAKEYSEYEIKSQQQSAMLRGSSTPGVRDQLDDLCVALESGTSSAPQTTDQWRRCLKSILRGDDWRYGTWK